MAVSCRIPHGPIAKLMEPALAARFPEIRTYRGQGIDDPSAAVHCDWSPRGFHAMIAYRDTTVTIHPLQSEDLSTYVSYDSRDQERSGDDPRCVGELPSNLTAQVRSSATSVVPLGATLRTYRIVIATTQEYTNTPSLGGGTVARTLASINTWLNNLNSDLRPRALSSIRAGGRDYKCDLSGGTGSIH